MLREECPHVFENGHYSSVAHTLSSFPLRLLVVNARPFMLILGGATASKKSLKDNDVRERARNFCHSGDLYSVF